MSVAQPDPGGTDLDQTHADRQTAPATPVARRRPMWLLFIGLAVAVIVVDQLSKAWVIATIDPSTAIQLIADYVRLIYSRNDGALFGMFGSAAPILAITSIGVIGLIVWYHARSGRNPLLSIALGLLLGGAIGNLIDRLRYGYVVDWVDMGVGDVRYWTFNLGDAAISTAIVLLIVLAVWPSLGGAAADA